MAFIGIYLDKAIRNPEAVKQLRKIDEVIECHYTTGNWSIFVKLLCRDNEHLMELLNKKIQSVEGVSRTETFISLQQQLIVKSVCNLVASSSKYLKSKIGQCSQRSQSSNYISSCCPFQRILSSCKLFSRHHIFSL